MAVKKSKKGKSNGKAARSAGKRTLRAAGSKTAAKKKSASKASAVNAAAGKLPSIKEPLTKGTMIKTITDVTCLGRKDVVAVLDCLTSVIEKHVKTGGPGVFVMPGMMKISVIRKPARPARKGVNPFTGEEIMIKAKPAHKVVKIRALKKLKEMVI
jgi:nucleoid DNA-binding protein